MAATAEALTPEQCRRVLGQAWEGSGYGGESRIRAAVVLSRPDPTALRLQTENRELRAAIESLRERMARVEESR